MKKNKILLLLSFSIFIILLIVKNYYIFEVNKTKDILIYLGIIFLTTIPLLWTPYLKKIFHIFANLKSELRKINWAKNDDVLKGFVVVVIFVSIIGSFVILSDYLLFEAYSIITK